MYYDNVKLYEIASMLSPSVYETIFYSQYQGRSDKDAIILDDETFERCYVSDSVYRNFLFSNSIRLGKSVDYIGLSQMHGSIVKELSISNNQVKIKLLDVALTNLAKTLMNMKSMDIKLPSFYLHIIFNNVNYYSNNNIDENEKLIPTDESVINSAYIQDQLTFINDKYIEMVISTQNTSNKLLRYMIFNCGSVDVLDESKDLWKNTFKNDFSMLYEYFVNVRKSNNLIIEGSAYENIIVGYEKFMNDFMDLDDL